MFFLAATTAFTLVVQREVGGDVVLKGGHPVFRRACFEPYQKLFGISLSVAPDCDGDGQQDIMIGAPGDDPGSVYFYSSRTCEPIGELVGPSRSFGFGIGVCYLSDLDGDGVNEIAVGEGDGERWGTANNHVWVISMKKRNVLYEVLGAEGEWLFGSSLQPVGDLTGDAVTDLAVGFAPDPERSGLLFVDGSNGSRLYSLQGHGSAFTRPGRCVPIPDLNGDSIAEVVVGFSERSGSKGTAWIHSGRDGTPFLELVAESARAFGAAVARIDHEEEGVRIVVGAPGGDENCEAGVVFCFSRDGSREIWRTSGSDLGGAVLELGASLLPIGDTDGDGWGDVAVSSYDFFGVRIHVLDGRTGSVLREDSYDDEFVPAYGALFEGPTGAEQEGSYLVRRYAPSSIGRQGQGALWFSGQTGQVVGSFVLPQFVR